jgi:hypothetical protein
MRRIKEYDDFIFDSLLENMGGKGILPFVFTREFEKILQNISHPIADEFLMHENQNEPLTLIDVTENNDIVSFATSPKIIEFLMSVNKKPKEEVMGIDFYTYLRKDDSIWDKYRSTIKIGKLVKKIFGDKFPDNGKPGTDIESFVNAYKSVFKKDDIMTLFDIVDGNDIPKWYEKDRYADNGHNSPLYQSCMNDCEDYLRFYAINVEHIKMVILYEDDKKKKIVGRALLWDLDIPEDRKFMDRIYSIHDFQVDFFKEYAKKNGWLYKSEQRQGNEVIVDPTVDDKGKYMEMGVRNIKLSYQYPYLDTLRYLDQERKILSTRRISDVRLTNTWGGADDCEWSEVYNIYINTDNLGYQDSKYVLCEVGRDRYSNEIDNIRKKEDAVYLPYYGEWIAKDNYDKLIIKTTIPREQDILRSETIFLRHYGEWAEENYVDQTMVYSEHDDDHYYEKDSVFSRKLDSYIWKDSATKVFTDVTKTETDYVPDKELSKLTFTNNGDYILNK